MNVQNRSTYSWNPAYNLVMKVKDSYFNTLAICYERTEFYQEYERDLNFNHMLEFLGDEYFDEVFSFLDVTQYNNFILLKYKGYQYIFNDGINDDNFWEMYNGLFNYCRSVVIDLKNESIVLAPQNKFFNLNQIEGSMLEDVQKRISKARKVEISNKLDGSNQNGRYYNGEIVLSGSQALDPKQSWRLADGYSMLTDNYKKMMQMWSDYTFMYEYISQKDAHVVLYSKDQEGLYLFGMRNVRNGLELPYEVVLRIGKEYNVKTTEIFDDTLEDIMSKVDDYTSDEKEGWVIGIQDMDNNIFKVKLKINDYVHMHHLLSKLTSPNLVIEAIAENKFDDFVSKVPMTHRDKIYKYSKIIYNYVNQMEGNTRGYYHIAPKENKKDFMIWVDKIVPQNYKGYVRSIYLHKDYNFLKKGNVTVPSYKKYNNILKEMGISNEDLPEEE